MSKSGDWIGYYNYGDGLAPHAMELSLSFSGSSLSGRGIDDVGHFTVQGGCSSDTCSWIKTYSSHSIKYQGFVEGDQSIWGTWSAGLSSGGFKIWPKPVLQDEVEVVALVDKFMVLSGGGKHGFRR